MYHDEIFENALKDVKEESYKALKEEISTMESAIEKVLRCILNSTSFRSERDFHVSSVQTKCLKLKEPPCKKGGSFV